MSFYLYIHIQREMKEGVIQDLKEGVIQDYGC